MTIKTAIINAAINSEMEQIAIINNANGTIVRNLVDFAIINQLSEKDIDKYLEKLVAAKVKAGTPKRSADTDKSNRKPILMFLSGHTDIAVSDAILHVKQFLETSNSMQALSKQVKSWIKDGLPTESDDTDVNIIDTETDDDTEADDTPTQESKAVQQAIEAEKTKIDDLHAYLFEALKQGWTLAQMQDALDELACVAI